MSEQKTPILEIMEARKFRCETKNGVFTLPYRVFVPEQIGTETILILFLHGAGERGTDNRQHVERNNQFLERYLNSEYRTTHPAVVLAPQCPLTWKNGKEARWSDRPWGEGSYYGLAAETEALHAVTQLCRKTIKQYGLDTAHSIITGISMGGFGTWDLICRYPGLFWKAVPVCGGGSLKPEDLECIVRSGIHIWTFHGDADDTVPVQSTRDMVQALEKYQIDLRYTEYPGVMHGSWDPAYREKSLFPWIFDF